ncbi:TPA: RIP metalloprotease RseP [bacterium]|nr:RIP metalloprotease RseP [bacterium]
MILTKLLGILVTFGIAIFIHELGHFILAKLFGIRVETFSLGFGKRLIGFKYKGTDYRLSIIPFGGYVKLPGEEPGKDKPIEEHEFLSKPWWKRMAVYLGGPFFSMGFAIPLFIMLFIIGVPMAVPPNLVGRVESGLLGEKAGIRVKDEIIEVSGKKIQYWDDLATTVDDNPSRILKIKVLRDGHETELIIEEDSEIKFEDLGLDYLILSQIGRIKPNYPAAKAGLKEGDIITSIDGRSIITWDDLTEIVYQSSGMNLRVGVKRGSDEFEVELVPVEDWIPKTDGGLEKVGLIGISPPVMKIKIQKFPLLEAIPLGLGQALGSVKLTIYSLGMLLSGQASWREVTGPVGIARMAGEHAQRGLNSLLFFIAFLSINLGVLNLLPIPVVDGGNIVFCLIEGVRRKMVSLKIQEIAIKIGFALIISLFVFTTLNDLSKTKLYQGIKEKAFEWIKAWQWQEE